MHSNSSILLIGSGRLAKHLRYWNQLLDKPNHLLTWNRSQRLEQLNEHLTHSSLIWLAISDSSIVDFFETHLAAKKIKTVHFSGALHDSRILNAHPLMSFPDELLPADIYPQIHFTINGTASLEEILPNFKNKFTPISEKNKAYYHALCVMAGNFPQIIWNETEKEFSKLQLPAEAFELYIKQISENYLRLKEKSITGPLVRKDLLTIEKNILSLEKNEKLQQVYGTFAEEFSL